ncbi:hypothetical protein EYZ11_004843 [Aspergillus tanneri]|nr:hypothetical protein EYZ11_004843 [Aspergillus tanneri]
MIQTVESKGFVNFPDHDSFEEVVRIFKVGDMNEAQDKLRLFQGDSVPGQEAEETQSTDMDMKEQLLINAYNELLDFFTDYQVSRTGKLPDWYPHALNGHELEGPAQDVHPNRDIDLFLGIPNENSVSAFGSDGGRAGKCIAKIVRGLLDPRNLNSL